MRRRVEARKFCGGPPGWCVRGVVARSATVRVVAGARARHCSGRLDCVDALTSVRFLHGLMHGDHVMPNFRIRQSLRVVIQVAGHHGRCSMPLDSGATSSGCRARRGVPSPKTHVDAVAWAPRLPTRRARSPAAPRASAALVHYEALVPGEHGAARVRRRRGWQRRGQTSRADSARSSGPTARGQTR